MKMLSQLLRWLRPSAEAKLTRKASRWLDKHPLRAVAALAFLLACAPAFAQQTAVHSIPIGKGSGNTGFNAAVPGTAGLPLVSQGPSADPNFGLVANGGLTAGAANTAKGSLNGTTVIDLPLPSCTAVNQAWKYTSGTGINCSAVSVFTGYDVPVNLGLSASASGSALTLTLTQASGAAPTSSSPVLVPFRSLVATTGTVTWSTISATQSITVPNGGTLGTSNGVPFKIWIFEEYNGGTPELAVATCSNPTTVFACAAWESTLQTSTTIGVGSPTNTAGALLAPTGVASDAVRIIGFCEFANGLTTAGVWTSSCTTLQVFGPGVKKPGDTVQSVYAATGGTVTCATGSPYTVTDITAAIKLANSSNLVMINAVASVLTAAAGDGVNAILARNGSAIGNNVNVGGSGTSTVVTAPAPFMVLEVPASLSALTYAVYCQGVGGAASETGGSIVVNEIQG